MEGWLTIVAVVVGASLAWLLNELAQSKRRRDERARALSMAAYLCLDRLRKIKLSFTANNINQCKDEYRYLGEALDALRNCIAENPKPLRAALWPLYKRAVEYMFAFDGVGTDELMRQFEALVDSEFIG